MQTPRAIRRILSESLVAPIRQYYRANRLFRRVFLGIALCILVTKLLTMAAHSLSPTESQRSQQLVHRYSREAQTNLQNIHTSSGLIIDSLAESEYISLYTQFSTPRAASLFLQRFVDIWSGIAARQNRVVAGQIASDVGLAIYDVNGRLRSWYTENISSPDFDTVFSQAGILEHRSRLSGIDSTVRCLNYITARKLFSRQGYHIGYIVLKYKLADRDWSTDSSRYWKWGAMQAAGSYVGSYVFTASVHVISPMEIFLDSNERSAPVGYVTLHLSTAELDETSFTATLADIGGATELLLAGLLIVLVHHLFRVTRSVGFKTPGILWLGIVGYLVAARVLFYLSGSVPHLLSRCSWFGGRLSTLPFIDTAPELFLSMALLTFAVYCFHRFWSTGTVPSGVPLGKVCGVVTFFAASISIPLLYYALGWIFGYLLGADERSMRITTGADSSTLGIWLSLTLLVVSIILSVSAIQRVFVRSVGAMAIILPLRRFILFLFTAAQIAAIAGITTLGEFYPEQAALMGGLFLLTLWIGLNEGQPRLESLRLVFHPALVAVLLGSIAGVYLVLTYTGARSDLSLGRTVTTSSLPEPLPVLSKYIRTVRDSTIRSPNEYNIRSFSFWLDFFHTYPKSRIQFEIADPASAKVFVRVGEPIRTGIGTDTIIFAPSTSASVQDSSGGLRAAALIGASTPLLAYRCSVGSIEERTVLPSDRISRILWGSPELPASGQQPDPLHLAMLIVTACIIVTFICFALSFFYRLIDEQSFRYRISLQEKLLLLVFLGVGVAYRIVIDVSESALKSNVTGASHEHFRHDVAFIRDEIATTAHLDSLRVVERHLASAAEGINSDILLYGSNNILLASSCPECVRYGLIPLTMPSGLPPKVRSEGIVTTVSSAQVRLAGSEIQPVGGGNRPVQFLLIEKEESYDELVRRITANMSDSLGALALLALLAASYLATRIVQPLKRLQQATTEVASGTLAVLLPRERGDEIGDVIDAFGRMTVELSSSRERVAQIEREGAWKEMARQVAHEIKNPLTPIKLSIQHVQHAFEHQDTNFPNIFRRVLKTISEQIDVLTRIATEFARFGEMPRRRYSFITLRQVSESAIALFEAERSHIRFAIDIPEGLSKIYADEEEFRRALVNLIKNAVQAISGWGIILIAAEERSGLIYIRISDSGAGMKQETVSKAFDPNFSTKTSGMGLGLAIVKRTITDMSGTIRVESETGKGTTFFIELPARDPSNI